MITFLKNQYYTIILGITAITLMALLILYLVLAMISVTSGVSQTIGVPSGTAKTVLFDLEAADRLNLD
ncbi:MAG: hypothetical protein AAB903_02425 [Patescibacteria group bacterium]